MGSILGTANQTGGNAHKGIILDFDGVILESNHIKAETFRRLFNQYPEHGDRIVKLHMDHGGMSRFEKFRIIYQDILQRSVDDAEVHRLSMEFGRLADEQLMACPFAPGALEFLKAYSTHYDLFIASGTPEDELQDLVSRRDLSRFFKGVYGSPRHKGEILRDILSENRWLPHQVLFVGDAIDDYNGAKEASVPFIGRVAPGAKNSFEEKEVEAIVSDLGDLNRRWQTLVSALSSR